MKVKICGITDVETGIAAVEYGADAIGFVFAESKRRISIEKAREIIAQIYLKRCLRSVFLLMKQKRN